MSKVEVLILHPVTYFPPATQRQLLRNRALIRGKDYAHFFREDLWLHDDVLPFLKRPLDPHDAVPASADLSRILDTSRVDAENGYYGFPDGTGYVASLTKFPGSTPEMFSWWFWWHSIEPARYTLWYPWNHISAIPQDQQILKTPGLTHEQRYIGNTHDVDEYIGPGLERVSISFKEPQQFGLDESVFGDIGIRAHACADIYRRRPMMHIGKMLHLAYETDDGFELRSRYWLGDQISLGRNGGVNLDRALSITGIKDRIAGERLAYEQLLHDQIEFTHLAGILSDLYREFGPGRNSA